MIVQRIKKKFHRVSWLFLLFLLAGSLVYTTLADQLEENDKKVINIEPSQTDIGTDSHRTTDSSVDSQTTSPLNDQTPIPPLSVEVLTPTVEDTLKVLTETADVLPTVSDSIRTSSEYDNTPVPSSSPVVPSASKQETSSDAAMETSGTSQSIYTDQSEEVVVQKLSDELTGADKSPSVSTPEQQKEMPPESPGQATVEEGKTTEKVDQELPTDAEHKPVVQGEAEAPTSTSAVKEETESAPDSKPGPADEAVPDKTVAKPDDDGELTFSEWRQRVLAEEDKEKHHAKADSVSVTSTKQRKKKNYALHECGAKILATNPEATNVKSVLNPNKDDYMISPCKVKQWFVAELCEPIQAMNVELASFELFSSQPKGFKVYLSDRYPTKDWKLAVHKEMSEERAIQSFDVNDAEGYFAKYVRVELLDHYGHEHYCPLTLFRLFGVGVVDYDDSDGDDADHDEPGSDDEEVPLEEDGGDSRNLFSSAKDTVLKIVKKVLNVDDIAEEVQKLNETLENIPQNQSIETTPAPLNTSADAETSLPCPPDVTIPGGNGESEPEIRDDGALVTKLEDHEQIETGDQSFLRKSKQKSMQKRIQKCLSCTNHLRKVSLMKSVPLVQFCVYVKLFLDRCRGHTCAMPMFAPKTENEQKEENKMQTSQVTGSQTGSQILPLESKPVVTKLDIQSDKLQASVTSDESKLESVIETTSATFTDHTGTLKDEIMPTLTTKIETRTFTEVIPEHSEVEQKPSASDYQSVETIIPTQSVLMQQSNAQSQDSITTDTSKVVEPRSERTVIDSASDMIQPSPSIVTESEQNILASTPELSQTKILSESSSSSISTDKKAEQASPETAFVLVDTSYTTKGTLPVEPSASIAIEPPHTVKQEPVQDQQEREPLIGKPPPKPEETIIPPLEHVVSLPVKDEVAENKAVESESKKKNLDLVKVPLVPLTKRETAIMRLNNRIKTLEQNVSLSSRFLEELSKRYKKQSEDMMKLLNNTVARLNNATLEAQIKDKLHDDAIAAMESKVENLTAIVTELTVKLDTLNRQVTDRQMIWTSIEIIVLLIVLIIIFRRGKNPTLTPEIKEIIQTHSVPNQSAKPAYRRNSISGPSTPLKSKSDLDPGPVLQRHSSETSLVHTEFPVIEPGESPFFTPKPKDGQKKKKKKKHKNMDSKYHVGLKESNSDVNLQSGGTNSAHTLSGSSINSASVLFRDKSLETSLQRSNGVTNEKHLVDSVRGQRSDSSLSGSSSGTSFGVNVCDRVPKGAPLQGVDSKVNGNRASGLSLESNTYASKKSKASPPLQRNEKSFVKTHKRQKSLPNTPTRLPVVETLGRVDDNVLDNTSSDNLVKEKKHSLQKGTSKGRGVRKSLSMTAPSKGSRSTTNAVNGDNKVNSVYKIERHTTQHKGNDKMYNGINDYSAINGSMSCNVLNNSDSAYDNEQRTVHSLGRGGIKGSKSCCSTDPGGSASFGHLNGHGLNENVYINGHSLNGVDSYSPIGKMNGYSANENFHLDKNPDFQKDNTAIPNRSGWRKMIWWS